MKVIIASGNPGKLREFQQLFDQDKYPTVNQSELAIEDAVEDGESFEDNALIKARHASSRSGLAAIADDSGLCVDCLDGEPGIFSARYAGENATDGENIAKLLGRLEGVPFEDRMAHFHCTLVMVKSAGDPAPLVCTGKWHGYIAESPAGGNGFGYDPVFFLPEFNCTSAELPEQIKNKNSHRGMAMKKLVSRLV